MDCFLMLVILVLRDLCILAWKITHKKPVILLWPLEIVVMEGLNVKNMAHSVLRIAKKYR